MANKDIVKIFSLVLTLVIVILGLLLSLWAYTFINKSLVAKKKNVAEIEINSDLYQKISEPTTYGASVTATEEGYGRDNPFAPYKALPSAQESSETTTEVTPAQ